MLLVAGGISINVTVSDISELGLGVFAPAALEDGLECVLALALPGTASPRRLNAWGKVIYSIPMQGRYRIGISLVDMDSRSLDCIRCLALGASTCKHRCASKL